MNKNLGRSVSIIFVSFILWESACAMARTASFPHSWAVVGDLLLLTASQGFWSSLAITIWLSTLGLLIGCLFSLGVGLLIGLVPMADKSTSGVLNFFRSVPSVVYLPLLVASIGASTLTVITLTSLIVFLKLVLYVIRGVRDTDQALIESARAMGMKFHIKILYIYLPSAISIVGTGLRLSASRAFGTVVAAGIIVGSPGIGQQLSLAESNGSYTRVFSYICVMGLIGTFIYTFFSALENKIFVWRVTT